MTPSGAGSRTALLLVLCALASDAAAQGTGGGVARTKHNMSFSGPGRVRSLEEDQICKFCHPAHAGGGSMADRGVNAAAYSPYESATLTSRDVGPPGRSSRACLACHDGTIALGQVLSPGLSAGMLTSERLSGAAALGTDLRRSHPIGLRAARSRELRDPSAEDDVKLDRRGRIECTSCHDPHVEDLDPIAGKFLVKSNRGSAICSSCHLPDGWMTNPAAHQISTAALGEVLAGRTGYTTVADLGCGACHQAHANATQTALLRVEGAALCLECHDGRVAQKDLRVDSMKPYTHPVLSSVGRHDAAEGASARGAPLPERSPAAPRHVTCVDCHDPHAAFRAPAIAPLASGALAGVWGIDASGQRVEHVRHEYEVCFKCHGDSANQPHDSPTPPPRVRRAVRELNLRRVFDATSAASFHPIEAPGRGRDVPSLKAPLTTSSVIYCSDCHSSDSAGALGGDLGGAPRGPHGSIYPHILERNLSTADFTVESETAYALCYKCHDRQILLSSTSAFPHHAVHVERHSTPCTACHNPHGVSARQGDAISNAHLIDFDVSIVQPSSQGIRRYTSLGGRGGRCSTRCHGMDHVETAY